MILLFLFLTLPLFAFAYLDPGTGSFIIHVIVGGLVGIAYWARLSWRSVTTVVKSIVAKFNGKNIQRDR